MIQEEFTRALRAYYLETHGRVPEGIVQGNVEVMMGECLPTLMTKALDLIDSAPDDVYDEFDRAVKTNDGDGVTRVLDKLPGMEPFVRQVVADAIARKKAG